MKASIFGLLLFISIAVVCAAFYNEGLRYSHYVKKYAELNIDKNHGIHRLALKVIKSVAGLFPMPSPVSQENIKAVFQGVTTDIDLPENVNLVPIESKEALIIALNNVTEETIFVLQSGTYEFNKQRFTIDQDYPVWLVGESRDSVVFNIDTRVGINILSSNVSIANIHFKGVCDIDEYCDHAIHIKKDADNILIVNNDFQNFNSAIKSNGELNKVTKIREFPDFVSIKYNRFYNDWIRQTALPVTPIDVVGGDYWNIRYNFIADFSKERGNKVSYGAFLKGAGSYGNISGNFVACSWKVPHFSSLDARIGLSLGGGGTGKDFCQTQSCEFEHHKGMVEDNVIVNCETEVAIYANKSDSSEITRNILYNTIGIDVSAGNRSLDVTDNIFHGTLRSGSASVQVDARNNRQANVFSTLLDVASDR